MTNDKRPEEPALDDQTDLVWFFNEADGCLGLAAFDPGAVGSSAATSEAAERKQERMSEAAARYRRVAKALNRLPATKQASLRDAFLVQPVPMELSNRSPHHVAAAATSEAARRFLIEMGARKWSPKVAKIWLARAEYPSQHKGVPVERLQALKVEAWAEAEVAVDAMLGAYAAARRAVREDDEATRRRREDEAFRQMARRSA